jgi:hypothetical protein
MGMWNENVMLKRLPLPQNDGERELSFVIPRINTSRPVLLYPERSIRDYSRKRTFRMRLLFLTGQPLLFEFFDQAFGLHSGQAAVEAFDQFGIGAANSNAIILIGENIADGFQAAAKRVHEFNRRGIIGHDCIDLTVDQVKIGQVEGVIGAQGDATAVLDLDGTGRADLSSQPRGLPGRTARSRHLHLARTAII